MLQTEGIFFDGFARSKNFNPLDAEKWYSVTNKEIMRAGGAAVLHYHKRSHFKALAELYPELMLKKGNFFKSQEGWKANENQRKFFDEFAKSKHFDPLDTQKWYSFSRSEISKNGGAALLRYYKGSYITALKKLYPELGFKRRKRGKKKE